jgi:hypothetical protein
MESDLWALGMLLYEMLSFNHPLKRKLPFDEHRTHGKPLVEKDMPDHLK